MLPRKIWIGSITLAAILLLAFLLVNAQQSRDAQWQLQYWPFWVIDFPVSFLYFVCPIPWAEGLIGPIW